MRFLCLGLIFTPLVALAQGGPPMVTDDPATPGDGHWEINIASLYAGTAAQDVLQAPYFDINYGWGDRIQLKLETGLVSSWEASAPSQSGAGTALVGVKYRFLDEATSGISVSTYPQIQFRHFFSSHDPEIASPGNQYVLPIEMEKTFGAWAINPEIGYLYGTQVTSEIFYGLVVAFEKAKPWEPLIEVHVNTHFDGTGSTTLLNFGVRYSATANLNWIGALGHTLTTSAHSPPETDSYLGLQLEI